MEILSARKLKKYYGEGDSLVKALDGVDLSVEQGEFVAVVGSSGSGWGEVCRIGGKMCGCRFR